MEQLWIFVIEIFYSSGMHSCLQNTTYNSIYMESPEHTNL